MLKKLLLSRVGLVENLRDRLPACRRAVMIDEPKGEGEERLFKQGLDRLGMLGLTIRTLIDGAAAIRLTSPFLASRK